MKLVSAVVRNYRLHRDLTVEFDASRTLIGGPNEAGKSTLIEAIHRGLFLKSRGATALHKSMKSTRYGDHPEVEVCFEKEGTRYTVHKRFSGQSGTTRLTEGGGETLQGEAAEERLAALLGSEDPAGRVTAGKINEQWAHLWVWQGMSGDDPVEHAAAQQADLLQRLQDTGGSVAMQSELDGRVAGRFAKARTQAYVRDGRPKAGSGLAEATEASEQAEAAYAAARERMQELEQAVADFETAEATLERTAPDREKLVREQRENREQIARAERLRQELRDREREAGEAKDRLQDLEAVEQQIAALRKEAGTLRDALKPKRDVLERAESERDGLRERTGKAERAVQEARAQARRARLRRDLAAAWVAAWEKRARRGETRKRLDRVRARRDDLAGYRRKRSGLPAIDRKELAALQELDRQLGEARAAVKAMATGIDLLAADQPVQLGDELVEPGEGRTITESTEVRAGEHLRLRIRPGGGDRLDEARGQVCALEGQLREGLDRHGLESIAGATEVVAKREGLDKEIEGAEATLEELHAQTASEDHAAAEDELTAAEARVAGLLKQMEDLPQPDDLEAARTLRDAEQASVQDAEEAERRRIESHQALQDRMRNRDEELKTLRGDIEADGRKLDGVDANVRMLLTHHGDDAARERAIEAARKAVAEAERTSHRTGQALQVLQPDLLEPTRERLERAVREIDRQREEARTRKAVSGDKLRSSGAEDPQATLAGAEANRDAARAHLRSVSRKARAIALLDHLFVEQQQQLANRFSQPLADRITGYLQALFGRDVRAVVRFEDTAFTAIELVRSASGGATAFDVLSGGTREQVAAAVRLAIAELLAAGHGGSLPLVFDDAFAYSDPQRVRVLQRMLDLGAARGLQIIVLTCNPSDYAGLGARHVLLAPDADAQAPPETEARGAGEAETAPAASPSGGDAERLLSVLGELGGSSGNQALRARLGWDEATYAAVKDALVDAGRILPGRGRGGSVSLP